MQLNEEIAELCGAILGDGHVHTRENRITITGSLEDIHYYKKRIIPLFEKHFNVKATLRKRKDRNSYYFWIHNKNMFNFFLEVGFSRGHKSKAGIPISIKKHENLIPPFLRGLFDTDGCLKFSIQSKSYNYYPRIRLCFQESPLINDLREVLDKLNFNYGFTKDRRFNTRCFEISGKDNLEKWMKIINMGNPVHKSKYLYWKKFGRYIPRSTLKERLNTLDLDIKDLMNKKE